LSEASNLVFNRRRRVGLLLVLSWNLTGALLLAADEKMLNRNHGAGAEPRVILLTGFEPFGADRSPNASWEGIKGLDGRNWNGYRLVSKKIPVIWGKPLEHLRKLNSEYHPVAIFSFGMGGYGAFALETRASNLRGNIPDNDDRLPSMPSIVEGGPHELRTSLDASKFARKLKARGFPVRVSGNAGRYLCEEMLYSLEYWKSSDSPKATVLFCHVPPIDAQQFNVPYDQKFVLALLDCWLEMQDVANTKTRSHAIDPVGTGASAGSPTKRRQFEQTSK
jgi:pyroglutamyl-peptidase